MPAGVVLVQVADGCEAREVCERLAGCETYYVDHGGAMHIFPDDPDEWFRPVAVTMSNQEFFRRFVGAGH